MSMFSKAVTENRRVEKTGAEVNYMGGISYKLNPLDTLRMVTASSIFGEPQYYRDGEFGQATINDAVFRLHKLFKDFAVIGDHFEGKKTSEVMELVIDDALDYDYGKTLEWAVTLRREFNINNLKCGKQKMHRLHDFRTQCPRLGFSYHPRQIE